MKISVVIPVHNEEENVLSLTNEICETLNCKADYELIFVDDGSTDQTRNKLLPLQNSLGNFRFIRHRLCCGQSTALLTGIRRAQNPLIVTLDGDGQNDPEDIHHLLKIYEKEQRPERPAMITGFRYMRQDTGWRKISSKIANLIRGRLLKDFTPDTGCGLKVFSRELFLSFPYFDHMHRFLPALTKRAGGRVVSVKVNHRQRAHGRSHYGTLDRLWVGIIDLFGVMWLLKRAKIPIIERSSLKHE